MAQKVNVDTIEKLIYKLEMNLNQAGKYSHRDRQLMHDGIEWLRRQQLLGKTFKDILEDFKNFPLNN
tara:strand:+ start:986 stop:1186 length:201 start_codon:yes stop_codon:yes gene_type:complete